MACGKHGTCGSFAYCPGNLAHKVNFSRCFLKTKQVDFGQVVHKSLYPTGGDCKTFKKDGVALYDTWGIVARNEGSNVFSYRENCAEDGTCLTTTPDEKMCQAECSKRPACKSFAFCSGESEIGFPRCFLKTADFDTILHSEKYPDGPGDCKTYYPKEAGTCKDVKAYYKTQECCKSPEKTLNFNILQTFD
jgi:hypothetical protein